MSTTDRIRAIQLCLGVPVDGILGPVTLSAIERALAETHLLAPGPGGSLKVSRASLLAIVSWEVASERYYTQFLAAPYWPGGASGVTIGIGYDLGYQSVDDVRSHWQPALGSSDVYDLLGVVGLKGADAASRYKSVRHVKIPWSLAIEVFYASTLPHYAALCAKTFPGIIGLPPHAQGAILSLVYNRGASLVGERRQGMAKLAMLIAEYASLAEMAEVVENMARLWPDTGLARRRKEEAEMIRNAQSWHGETVEV